MKRRFLDLCLLAYPRARRARDRAYLRDLALDLAETSGLMRQGLSLVRGGLGERIEARREAGLLSPRTKGVVAVCSVFAAIALASNLVGAAAGEGARDEVEEVICVETGTRDSCGQAEHFVLH